MLPCVDRDPRLRYAWHAVDANVALPREEYCSQYAKLFLQTSEDQTELLDSEDAYSREEY